MKEKYVPLKELQQPQNGSPLAGAPRFMITVFLQDNVADNPVTAHKAIACPDGQSAQLLFEMLERTLKVITYNPMNNG